MGIIKRQAFKQSAVGYVAAGVALISTLCIYPKAREIYGLAQWLVQTAFFLMPVVSFGAVSLAVKFFPEFKDASNKNNGLLFNLLLIGTVGFGLIAGISFVLRAHILSGLQMLHFDVDPIQTYAWYLMILTLILVYINILGAYISNFKRIVIPAIFRNLWIKIALPLLVLGYYWNKMDTALFVNMWLAAYVLVLLALAAYAAGIGALDLKPNFPFLRKALMKRMANFAVYSGLSSVGSVLSLRLDIIMLGLLLDMDRTGIYGIAAFMANVIEIPTKAIWQIAAPIISQAFKSNDMDEIREIYKKSSINLLVVGVLMYVLIVASLDDLFHLTAQYDSMVAGISVVFFLGLAKIIDMLTSVNNYIILYSKYYRWNLFFLMVMAAVNAVLNYFLIQRMGIVGAALATLISISLYNVIKMIFVWITFNMHPFSKNTWKVLVIGLVVLGAVQLLPGTKYPILNILLNSIVVSSIYVGSAYFLHISREMEEFVLNVWQKVTKR